MYKRRERRCTCGHINLEETRTSEALCVSLYWNRFASLSGPALLLCRSNTARNCSAKRPRTGRGDLSDT